MKRCKFCKGVRRFIRSHYERYLENRSREMAYKVAEYIKHEYPGESIDAVAKRIIDGRLN